MRSALFVDFDNVYSGLRKLDASLADRFARTPQRWMSWLVEALELPQPAADGARRRMLVRRCYPNPQVYQRFRPAFNLAGFEIVDCPSLTSEGKTSTDNHMVLDMVDLLLQGVGRENDELVVTGWIGRFRPEAPKRSGDLPKAKRVRSVSAALLSYLPGSTSNREGHGMIAELDNFAAYSRLADSVIQPATKEQLADVARLLAANCGYYQTRFGDVPQDVLLRMDKAEALESKTAGSSRLT